MKHKDDIFYPARDHEAGPGMWCIRSKRLYNWHFDIGSKMLSHIIAKILNNPDKYSEFDGYGLDSIRYEENWQYEHKDDVPPPKIQENIMKSILDVIGSSGHE